MKCLERAQLFAYAHQMLEAEVAERVRAHLDTCAACRATVAEYQRLETVLEEWKPAEPSPWFDARVRQAVKSLEAAPPKTRWAGVRWGWLATASVAVLVVAVSVVAYRSRKVPGPVAQVPTAPGLLSQAGQAQRASEPPQPALQPSSERKAPMVAAKKAAAPTETAKAKEVAGPLMAERMEMPAPTATAQAGRRALSATDQSNRAALQSEAQNLGVTGRSEAAAPALGVQAPAPPVTAMEGVPQGAVPVAPAGVGGAAPKAMVAPRQASRTSSALEGVGESTSQGIETRQRVLATPLAPLAPNALLSKSTRSYTPPPPGLLESFLKRRPDAIVTKKLLGTLEGQEGTKATFTAIVASDPANPAMKAKGLEVSLEDEYLKATAYLDDDRAEGSRGGSLGDFQAQLERLAKKDEVLGNWLSSGQDHIYMERGMFSVVANRPGDSPTYGPPRYSAFQVGWYKRGGEIGVHIYCFNPVGSFYFPGVEMGKVAEMVAAGRAFLNAN